MISCIDLSLVNLPENDGNNPGELPGSYRLKIHILPPSTDWIGNRCAWLVDRKTANAKDPLFEENDPKTVYHPAGSDPAPGNAWKVSARK
jgi:hypothetical protein